MKAGIGNWIKDKYIKTIRIDDIKKKCLKFWWINWQTGIIEKDMRNIWRWFPARGVYEMDSG